MPQYGNVGPWTLLQEIFGGHRLIAVSLRFETYRFGFSYQTLDTLTNGLVISRCEYNGGGVTLRSSGERSFRVTILQWLGLEASVFWHLHNKGH